MEENLNFLLSKVALKLNTREKFEIEFVLFGGER